MSFSQIPTISQNMQGLQNQQIMKNGIFYLEMSAECKKYLDNTVKFGYKFPNDDTLKKYTDGKFGGYHNREHDQVESFYVEKNDWDIVLPIGVQPLALLMKHTLDVVLKEALASADIPKELWNEGTGLVTNNGGSVHFSFNHYRPEKTALGLKPHKDFGFVTILYIEKPGLEAFYNGEWVAVDPMENHFVVILGRALEILINDKSKVTGGLHRVRQLSEERVSFTITCDSNADKPVKCFQPLTNSLETVHESFQAYLESNFEELYEKN